LVTHTSSPAPASGLALKQRVYRQWLAKTAKTFHGRAFCFGWNKTASKQFFSAAGITGML